MPRHKQRLSEIGGYALPPQRTPEGQAIRKFLRDHPSLPKREVAKLQKKAVARVSAQLENGAGLPVDVLIRYFLQEYNARNFKHGLWSMPASFNVVEAFVEYNPELNYFSLRDEQDHLISFPDFLDYATSPECPTDIDISTDILKEGVIYSFNAVNDLGEMTFSVSSGAEYGIGGCALVRHATELNVLLLVGEKTDITQKTHELKAMTMDGRPVPGREGITAAQELHREAVVLNSNASFWKVIALARFDLEDMTQNARYVLKDAGDSFLVLTDDVSVYLDDVTGNFMDEKCETLAKAVTAQVDQHGTLFELCKTCLNIPAYIEHYIDSVQTERHPTILLQNIRQGKWITKQKSLTPKERVTYRNVSVLRMAPQPRADSTSYLAPEFRVETSGYWKTLSVQEIGEDKHGNPIHGRTWVQKQLTWVQKQEPLVVCTTRNKRTDGSPTRDRSEGDDGYIYVMHNPAHNKDVFKVGLTKRNTDLRSDELSDTGSPDKFLVAHEWKVTDCARAEKIVHDALERYRINPKREFFRLPYWELMGIISAAVKDLQIGK